MLDNVKTVQTQSMQLWFNRDIWDLGWEARVMPSQTGSPVERYGPRRVCGSVQQLGRHDASAGGGDVAGCAGRAEITRVSLWHVAG